MERINEIIEAINNIDPTLTVTHSEVTKNTVKLQALNIRPDGCNIAPCIYIDNFLESDLSPAEIAKHVLNTYEHSKQSDIDIVPKLSDPEFIKSHIRIGLQRSDDTCTYITREAAFENIMEYLYLIDENENLGNISVKITEQLLSLAGIQPLEAWIWAENAVKDDIVIKSMYETLNGLVSDSETFVDADIDLDDMMWVVTNKSRHNGAAAVIYGFEQIRELGHRLGKCQAVIIFSSIHEAIVVFPDMEYNLGSFDSMINEVNTTLDPIEVLASRAYILDL